jgi:hypothetical protein
LRGRSAGARAGGPGRADVAGVAQGTGGTRCPGGARAGRPRGAGRVATAHARTAPRRARAAGRNQRGRGADGENGEHQANRQVRLRGPRVQALLMHTGAS